MATVLIFIKKTAIQMCFISSVLSLCACAAIVRTSELEGAGYVSGPKEVKIEASTPCAGQFYLFLGPFIGLPLPIIPNPIDCTRFYLRRPKIAFHIYNIPPHININNIKVKVTVNGNLIPSVIEKTDTNASNTQSMDVIAYSGIFCSQLDDSFIGIKIEGLSDEYIELVCFLRKAEWSLDMAP
jgi:hypothetical protein